MTTTPRRPSTQPRRAQTAVTALLVLAMIVFGIVLVWSVLMLATTPTP